MKIEFEGQTWELDTTHISYKHAMGIQSHTGMSIADWLDATGLESEDEEGGEGTTIKNPGPQWLPAVGGLYWLMRQQNGKPVAFDDMDFDYTDFYGAYLNGIVALLEQRKAERAAKAKAAEADPTRLPSPTASPESPTSATPMTTTPAPLVPVEVPAIAS